MYWNEEHFLVIHSNFAIAKFPKPATFSGADNFPVTSTKFGSATFL